MKRVKNLYFDKKMPKTSACYNTEKFLVDNFGNTFELYQRGKTEFYVDIPIGQNDIGIIYKGYFIECFSSNIFTLDFNKTFEKCLDQIKKTNINLNDNAERFLNEFKAFTNKKAV